MLYRRKKPVYWCVNDQTALAEAEVEYEEHSAPSVYVAFAAARVSPGCAELWASSVAFVIWTTTPWTLPANLAIAVHPKFEYVFYELGDRVRLRGEGPAAAACWPRCAGRAGGEDVKLPGARRRRRGAGGPRAHPRVRAGEELEGCTYRHPFYDRARPIILGEHVTLEAGTGPGAHGAGARPGGLRGRPEATG